ncbi:hypothetical protein V866_006663 [Kwoniella sp. B9012]
MLIRSLLFASLIACGISAVPTGADVFMEVRDQVIKRSKGAFWGNDGPANADVAYDSDSKDSSKTWFPSVLLSIADKDKSILQDAVIDLYNGKEDNSFQTDKVKIKLPKPEGGKQEIEVSYDDALKLDKDVGIQGGYYWWPAAFRYAINQIQGWKGIDDQGYLTDEGDPEIGFNMLTDKKVEIKSPNDLDDIWKFIEDNSITKSADDQDKAPKISIVLSTNDKVTSDSGLSKNHNYALLYTDDGNKIWLKDPDANVGFKNPKFDDIKNSIDKLYLVGDAIEGL